MQYDSIPYVITKKRLAVARADQPYTLVIMLGTVWAGDDCYQAKLKLPATSYRDGMNQYRKFVCDQKRARDRLIRGACKRTRDITGKSALFYPDDRSHKRRNCNCNDHQCTDQCTERKRNEDFEHHNHSNWQPCAIQSFLEVSASCAELPKGCPQLTFG